MTTTVLTVEPLSYNIFGNSLVLEFRGTVTAGKPVVKVQYPASLAPNSISDGVTALHALLHSTAGDVLVFAHSQGCQVVSRWLRAHADDNDRPDPERVQFLLIGNLLRKYGGAGIGTREVDGQIGLATPNNTDYTVRDVKLQYDGWADKPTLPGIPAAINAAMGKSNIHTFGYLTANLNHPRRKTYTENTTQYVMLPHAPAATFPRRWIERSYNRPES